MSDGLAAVLGRMEAIRSAFGVGRRPAGNTSPAGTGAKDGFEQALRGASGTPRSGQPGARAGAASTSASASASAKATAASAGTNAAARSKAASARSASSGASKWPKGLPEGAEKFRADYEAASAATGVPLNVLLAVSWAESAFDPGAESSVGAQGLMQLMPGTAASLGVDPNDPSQNILGGARYLAQQFASFGSWDLAFAAYNAGPGAVSQYGGIPPYRETQNYVAVINRYLDQIGAMPTDAPAAPPAASGLSPSVLARQALVPAPVVGAGIPVPGVNQDAAYPALGPSSDVGQVAPVATPTLSGFALSGAMNALATPLDGFGLQGGGGPAARQAGTAGADGLGGQSVAAAAATPLLGPLDTITGGLLSANVPTESVPASELPERLVALVQKARDGGQTSHRMTIRLDPPDLGMVSLRLEHRAGNVLVSLQAERPEAASLLNAQRDRIASVLQREGFSLAGFDVRADVRADAGAGSGTGNWSRRQGEQFPDARLGALDLDAPADLVLAIERGLRL